MYVIFGVTSFSIISHDDTRPDEQEAVNNLKRVDIVVCDDQNVKKANLEKWKNKGQAIMNRMNQIARESEEIGFRQDSPSHDENGNIHTLLQEQFKSIYGKKELKSDRFKNGYSVKNIERKWQWAI